MASTFSFDIESTFDKGELNNVVDQAQREIANRYDLKGSSANIVWFDDTKNALKITGDNDFHIDAILDITRKKLSTRGQSQKILDTSKEPTVSNMVITKVVDLTSGLSSEKAKKITTLLRDNLPKLKSQINGETVRVTGQKKDELQAAVRLIDAQDFDFPTVYTNFR